MKIRELRPDEAPAVLALWRMAEATPSATDTVEDIRAAAGHEHVAFLVAEADDTIVGSVIGTFDGWRGNFYRLAVLPSHRRGGVARALVARSEEVLRDRGARRFSALVEHDHEQAIAFWTNVGYTPDVRMTRFVRTVAGLDSSR